MDTTCWSFPAVTWMRPSHGRTATGSCSAGAVDSPAWPSRTTCRSCPSSPSERVNRRSSCPAVKDLLAQHVSTRLLRVKAAPISVSLSWGVSVGAVGILPCLPLPTKLHTRALAAIPAADGEDPADYAARVQAEMQHALSEMTRNRRPCWDNARVFKETGNRHDFTTEHAAASAADRVASRTRPTVQVSDQRNPGHRRRFRHRRTPGVLRADGGRGHTVDRDRQPVCIPADLVVWATGGNRR